jgi:hypothetical protein
MSIELMENLLEKVDKILDKANLPERHTFYQIQKFIIGKEPTGQAQLWAIVRELQARRDSVEAIKKDLRDAEDNLELLDLKIERLNRQIREDAKSEGLFTDLNIQEHEINIRKLQREKEALVAAARKVNKKLKSILEEMDFLAKGFELVLSQVGEMKPVDDEEAQKEMWNEKLLEEFNLRVILQRPLDPEFIKTVMCLHDEAVVKKHVVNLVENIQKKMIAEHQVNAQRTSIEAKPRIIGG